MRICGISLIYGLIFTSITLLSQERVICFVGGLNAIYGKPPPIVQAIREAHPHIPFIELKIGDGSAAATRASMHTQLKQIYQYARKQDVLKNTTVTLIGGSQGGLLALALIARHAHELPFKIDSLMTIASPLAGVYGLPGGWEIMLKQLVEETVSMFTKPLQKILESSGTLPQKEGDPFASLRKDLATIMYDEAKRDIGKLSLLFYNPVGQLLSSTAGYWHDPLQQEKYLKQNTFLPVITNEVKHPLNEQQTKNVASLQKILFIAAEADRVVKPFCSAERRFYKDGSTTEIEPSFRATRTYKENLLNLGAMYDDGRLVIASIPGAGHNCENSACIQSGIDFFNQILTLSIP